MTDHLTNELLPYDLVKIGREIYDLEAAKYVLCSKTPTMLSPEKEVYFISFSKNDHNILLSNLINLSENEQELVYQKIRLYLNDHPEKSVGFDGCCLHLPKQVKGEFL